MMPRWKLLCCAWGKWRSCLSHKIPDPALLGKRQEMVVLPADLQQLSHNRVLRGSTQFHRQPFHWPETLMKSAEPYLSDSCCPPSSSPRTWVYNCRLIHWEPCSSHYRSPINCIWWGMEGSCGNDVLVMTDPCDWRHKKNMYSAAALYSSTICRSCQISKLRCTLQISLLQHRRWPEIWSIEAGSK